MLTFPDKQLWNSKVSLKVSFLVWTLCYSGAPTLDKLYAAGMVQDSNCLFCDQMVETNENLFIHCSYVFEVWSYFLNSFSIKWVLSDNVKSNLWEWGDKKVKKSKNMIRKIWSLLPFTIWWCIWKERNAGLYNNLVKDVNQVIADIKCLLFNWGLASDMFSGFTLSNLNCNWDVVVNSSV